MALKDINSALIHISKAKVEFETQGDYVKVRELELVISTLHMSKKLILYGLSVD